MFRISRRLFCLFIFLFLNHKLFSNEIKTVKDADVHQEQTNGNDSERDANMLLSKILHDVTQGNSEVLINLNEKAVSQLVSQGINIHEANNRGETVLHVACFYGNVACVHEVLKVQGIDVNKDDIRGRTALHLACLQEQTDCIRELLKIDSLDINVKDRDGNTPLHLSCNKGLSRCVELLLGDERVELDCQNEKGDTALHIACKKGYHNLLFFKKDPKPEPNYLACVQKLLDKDADTTIENNEGDSAFMSVSEDHDPKIIRALLEKIHGAD